MHSTVKCNKLIYEFLTGESSQNCLSTQHYTHSIKIFLNYILIIIFLKLQTHQSLELWLMNLSVKKLKTLFFAIKYRMKRTNTNCYYIKS